MAELALPVVATLFVWWFATGLILYLDGLPPRSFKWTMLASTVLLGLAFAGLAASSAHATPAGAYCAFACAILVWAWQEIAFLLGYVTGPRRTPCPVGCTPWQRTRCAVETVLHHELALLLLALAVWALTHDAPNATGWWTFLILWAMRQSAKLNVFLGVRNLYEGFLPPHLKYLQSYFSRKPMNGLWPLSVAAATLVAVPVWQAALAAPGAFGATSATLLATLLTLAIVEHAFMVLPLPSEKLWQWGLRSHTRYGAAAAAPRVEIRPAD
mgnify:FL=1